MVQRWLRAFRSYRTLSGLRAPVRVSLVFVMAAAQPAQAQADYSFEALRRGDAIEVRAHALLDAPAQLVWQVISDYERLPQFVPGISRSVVLARQGNHVAVEQSGEARFGIFAIPIEVRYDVLEGAPDWIASHAVGGNLRRMSGRYEIHPDGERGGVVLHYFGTIEPDFPLLPLIGVAVLRAYAEEQFAAMAREIRRRAAEQRPAR